MTDKKTTKSTDEPKADKEASLYARIVAISNEIGKMQKDGRNREQNFDFISYAQVSGRMRELLNKHGVAIIPEVKEYKRDDIVSGKGKRGYHYTLTLAIEVVNTDKPEDRFVRQWYGESTDWGDKGISKAITTGLKYFYMRLFNVSEKGEDESDAHSAEEYKPKAPAMDFDGLAERVAGIIDLERLQKSYQAIAPKLKGQDLKRLQAIYGARKKELLKNGAQEAPAVEPQKMPEEESQEPTDDAPSDAELEAAGLL